jgi:hypothetical protein
MTNEILLPTVVLLEPLQTAGDGLNLHLEHLLNMLQSMQGLKWRYTLTSTSYLFGENMDGVFARILEVG